MDISHQNIESTTNVDVPVGLNNENLAMYKLRKKRRPISL